MARAAGSRELFWRQAQKCFPPQHLKFEGDRKQQKLSRLKPVKSAHTIGLENTMRIQTGSIETEFAHGKNYHLESAHHLKAIYCRDGPVRLTTNIEQ
jgi:hypothetical protein